ncbi:MAG TPA: 2-C-methyl-D-erythritol 4-phosphate cytidylyltransferase [Thermomicrobiales bacterium]|nr:2-C-methyl-D-erythritol 4-phosphate cytidylyltransferase [Thermomicrobiales bacterium]
MTGLPAPDRVAAVVVAAGRGERLGTPDKVVLPLAGRPMLAWSLRALEQAGTIGPVVVVAGSHTLEAVGRLVRDEGLHKVHAVVAGGERRQDSVSAGLEALPEGIEIVVTHDGARPLAGPELFDRCAAAAAEGGAAIAATPVADTLKRVAGELITSTVDRSGLWAAQTPQAFRLDLLRKAMTLSSDETVTDEARLCEVAGLPVTVVPSSLANLKVTRAEDIPVADALLRARHGSQPDVGPMRTGIGYDAHHFAAARRLVVGGVEIAHDRGLEGHSDADVLLHAIADAILGAAGLGDIGQHFPPSDQRFRDVDSQLLLREVVRLVQEAGWVPGNVDATLLAEAPRVAPYVPLMRERIALCLGLPASAISVKATTNEGMGFIGRGEGMAALATATLIPALLNSER